MEVERDHYYFINKVLEKDNQSKDKTIEMLWKEVKYFDLQKEQLLKAQEKFAKFYTLGLISSTGDLIQATSPGSYSDEMK